MLNRGGSGFEGSERRQDGVHRHRHRMSRDRWQYALLDDYMRF
jgi:hypothetical protein